MDANKLKVLQEVQYTIAPHCGICRHSNLSRDGWGVCEKHSYSHLKHSNDQRQLSITRMGSCRDFTLASEKVGDLHRFAEFLPR